MNATTTPTDYDVIVIGSGAAGLAAAVGYLEARGDAGGRALVVERGKEEEAPGNSRWTGGYLRMADHRTMAPDFLEDVFSFAQGDLTTGPPPHVPVDKEYFRRLAKEAPGTIEWLESLGVEFEHLPTIFLAQSGPRLLPAGGGNAVVETLTRTLRRLGGEVAFQTTAESLVTGEDGSVTGVRVRGTDGRMRTLNADAVVIASGGFQGNPEMMASYIGPGASQLATIAPGGACNRGDGIRMALDVGAQPSGQWDMIHAEPTDPRSKQPEAVVMLYPYGLLVNVEGRRFLDEGYDTVQETFEDVAYRVFREPKGAAWLVADQQMFDIPGYQRALLSEKGPYSSDTIEGLARLIEVDEEVLATTVRDFNAACGDGSFDATVLDGLATTGLPLPKSNWARPVSMGPYVAWPIACSVVFTFGGIRTDEEARVLSADGYPIPGLYTAGEVSGVYYHKYPGGTSFLRGLTFGRIAGTNIANTLTPVGS
jgi:tricarballylate dehydrogenase